MQLLGRDLLPEFLLSVFLTTNVIKTVRDPDLDRFSSSAFLDKKTIYFCLNSLISSSELGELFLVLDEAFIFCIIKQETSQLTDVAQRDRVSLGGKINKPELWRIQVFQSL